MNNITTYIGASESRNVSFLFIEDVLRHEKCVHFTEEQRNLVRTAYELADKLHSIQDRHNNKLYIYHIDRSVRIYLNETLYDGENCNPRYLIGLILHDCIEDNPNGLLEIINHKFDFEVILDVLFMSKPTLRVITQVMNIQQTHPGIIQQLRLVGFMQMYELVLENKPEKFLKNLQEDESITENMRKILMGLWQNNYKKKYGIKGDADYQNKVYVEFIFMSLIASMQPDLFRIKATERRDNMQDITGLLKKEKVQSAKSTMFTTAHIYIPRAREIGDDKLAELLLQDRMNEYAQFVQAGLLQQELI